MREDYNDIQREIDGVGIKGAGKNRLKRKRC